MNPALRTDLYELRMVASYLRRLPGSTATFSLSVRRLPPDRRFLVAAGLEECLEYLEALCFTPEDLEQLARLGFDRRDLANLSGLRFTGEVVAVPEGRIVFAGEPLLEVTAPLAEAQLVETALVNLVTFPTAVASKAARCRLAAAGRLELVEFGLRRAHGGWAGLMAARGAGIVGFSGTSNVEAAQRYGMPAVGTMAHSYVQAFPDEQTAFAAFAEDFPGQAVFLVDTFDTLSGVAAAVETIRELGLATAGVRLDSGDLVELARRTRVLLDEAGLGGVRIFASGNLDEYAVRQLVAAGAPIDAVGVGTRLAVSADAPYLETVYKLVEVDGRLVRKLSPGKASVPGRKQVWRGPQLRDWLARREEPPFPGCRPLLETVMVGGRRVGPRPSAAGALAAAKRCFESDVAELAVSTSPLESGAGLEPRTSPELARLAQS